MWRRALQDETLAAAPAQRLQVEREMDKVQQRISALRDLQPTFARAQVLQCGAAAGLSACS